MPTDGKNAKSEATRFAREHVLAFGPAVLEKAGREAKCQFYKETCANGAAMVRQMREIGI